MTCQNDGTSGQCRINISLSNQGVEFRPAMSPGNWLIGYVLVSVRLWDFFDVGSKLVWIWVKNQNTQRKPFFCECVQWMMCWQNLGMILGDKLFMKLKISNNVLVKNYLLVHHFLIETKNQKISMIHKLTLKVRYHH